MVKIKVVQEDGKYSMDELLEIMRLLRSENGCPWDIEQTHKSIRRDLLEEAYEVADAIDKADDTALCEELGDLLLQVIFHSRIAEEENSFDYSDVVDGIAKKLVLRHPHVFGEKDAGSASEVLDIWDDIKKKEKHQTSGTDTLKSVPEAFPALMRGAKVQKRAEKAGLKLENPLSSGETENLLAELKKAVQKGDSPKSKALYGRLLFSLARVGRLIDADPEEALNIQTECFINHFAEAENKAMEMNASIDEVFWK